MCKTNVTQCLSVPAAWTISRAEFLSPSAPGVFNPDNFLSSSWSSSIVGAASGIFRWRWPAEGSAPYRKRAGAAGRKEGRTKGRSLDRRRRRSHSHWAGPQYFKLLAQMFTQNESNEGPKFSFRVFAIIAFVLFISNLLLYAGRCIITGTEGTLCA